jgi:hypothetical protein
MSPTVDCGSTGVSLPFQDIDDRLVAVAVSARRLGCVSRRRDQVLQVNSRASRRDIA